MEFNGINDDTQQNNIVYLFGKEGDDIYNQIYSNELYHHGILGQKWGVRRYQNQDGTLTDAGRNRYQSKADRLEEKYQITKKKVEIANAKRELKAAKINMKTDSEKSKQQLSAQKKIAQEQLKKAKQELKTSREEAARRKQKADFDLKTAKYEVKRKRQSEKDKKRLEAEQKKQAEKKAKRLSAAKISAAIIGGTAFLATITGNSVKAKESIAQLLGHKDGKSVSVNDIADMIKLEAAYLKALKVSDLTKATAARGQLEAYVKAKSSGSDKESIKKAADELKKVLGE